MAQSNKPCQLDRYRNFDFWIGEWTVQAKGKNTPPASSKITLTNKGCSIAEDYTTESGYHGNSLSFYDSKNKKWHQTWIDNSGSSLYLDGGLENGQMVLTDGINRISWQKMPNGQVNQRWDVTKDSGKTWQTIFDGLYTRVK